MNIDKKFLQKIKQNKEIKDFANLQHKEHRKNIFTKRFASVKALSEMYSNALEYGKYKHHQHVENTENKKRDLDVLYEQSIIANHLLNVENNFTNQNIMSGMDSDVAKEKAKIMLAETITVHEFEAKADAKLRMERILESRRTRNHKRHIKKFGLEKAKEMIMIEDPFAELVPA